MTGAPDCIARSMIWVILRALDERQRAAEDGEVLREDIDEASGDRAVAADDAVAGRPAIADAEIGAIVGHEDAALFERAGVEEQLDALPGGEPAAFLLLGDAGRAAAFEGALAAFVELRLPIAAGVRGVPHPGPSRG